MEVILIVIGGVVVLGIAATRERRRRWRAQWTGRGRLMNDGSRIELHSTTFGTVHDVPVMPSGQRLGLFPGAWASEVEVIWDSPVRQSFQIRFAEPQWVAWLYREPRPPDGLEVEMRGRRLPVDSLQCWWRVVADSVPGRAMWLGTQSMPRCPYVIPMVLAVFPRRSARVEIEVWTQEGTLQVGEPGTDRVGFELENPRVVPMPASVETASAAPQRQADGEVECELAELRVSGWKPEVDDAMLAGLPPELRQSHLDRFGRQPPGWLRVEYRERGESSSAWETVGTRLRDGMGNPFVAGGMSTASNGVVTWHFNPPAWEDPVPWRVGIEAARSADPAADQCFEVRLPEALDRKEQRCLAEHRIGEDRLFVWIYGEEYADGQEVPYPRRSRYLSFRCSRPLRTYGRGPVSGSELFFRIVTVDGKRLPPFAIRLMDEPLAPGRVDLRLEGESWPFRGVREPVRSMPFEVVRFTVQPIKRFEFTVAPPV